MPNFYKETVKIEPEKLLIEAENYFGFTLKTKKRCRHIVDARKFICKYLRDKRFSLKQIANIFTQDHTTVIHSLRFMENTISIDKEFHEKYKNFVKHFNRIF